MHGREWRDPDSSTLHVLSVLEFDQAQTAAILGKLAKDENERGIRVDRAGNVWAATHIMKFWNNIGKTIVEIRPSSKAPERTPAFLGRPAGIELDEAAHELLTLRGKASWSTNSETGQFDADGEPTEFR